MIKTVIFDLDGTLLNRDESVKHFIFGQYERKNDYLNHIPKEAYTNRFIELDNRGYVWKDKVYRQLVEEFNIKLTWESLLDDYVNEFKYSCIAFPNLICMLEELKDNSTHIGIITNGKGQFQMNNIKALDIEKYFDTILISEWEGIKKPDPLIFRKALNQLNTEPYQSIFVGDHPEKDIQAAHKIGMKTIWKKDNFWHDVCADYRIDNLSEIPAIIKSGK
ncbi:HAD family hydrolase [Virgibacillus necropolis]|uniref:HAD family hydrolase n=1 Tax=Virgibacillus necropolis TaxID=163877 RepID=UPI00384BE2CD